MAADPSPATGPPTAHRPRAVAAALLVGVVCALGYACVWMARDNSAVPRLRDVGSIPLNAIALTIAVALWLVAPTRRAIGRALDAIRHPSPVARRVSTVAIALLAAATFYGLALAQGRPLAPIWHDSNMHMVQAQLIAHGRLWSVPPHPLADHMETFHVFVRPVYAAIHFPGTSMLYAPMLLLGIGPALFASLVAGAVVGLCYRVILEMVDGVGAAVAVPLLIAIGQLRLLSTMLMSHHVVLVPLLLAVWAYLHWRRGRGGALRWAAAIGACLGFAAITRPIETLAFAVAIAALMAHGLRGIAWRRWLKTAALVIAMTLPFVAAQLVFNRGVSGDWKVPPYEHYNRVFHPGLGYGGAGDASASKIPTRLPQKVDYYDTFITRAIGPRSAPDAVKELVVRRIPTAILALAPNPWLVVLVPPALLGLATRGRPIFAIAAVAYLALCMPYAIFLRHYTLCLAPLSALLCALGVHVIGGAFVGTRRSIEVLAVLCVVAMTALALPIVNPRVVDVDDTLAGITLYANGPMRADVRPPAAVLFRYRLWDEPFDPHIDNPHDEPVYTTDALWPEASPIARLHDLGPAKNREAYAFFAAREPGRNFYLFDRRSRRLVTLGTAAELLANGEPPAYFERPSPAQTPTR